MYNPNDVKFQQRTPTVLEKYIMFGVIAVLALSPLPFGSNRPFSWSVLSLFTGLLSLVWVSGFATGKIYQRVAFDHIKWAAYPFVAVIIWAFVQSFVPLGGMAHPLWDVAAESLSIDVKHIISLDSYKSFDNIMRIVAYGMLFWLSLQVGRSTRNAKIILKSVLYVAVFYAVLGLFLEFYAPNKLLIFDKKAYVGSLTSSFMNRNSYATYAGIGAVISILFLLKSIFSKIDEKNEKDLRILLIRRIIDKSILYIALLIPIIVALILTESRAGIFSSFIGVLVAISLFFMAKPMRQFKSLSKKIVWIFLTISIIVGVVASGGAFSRIAHINKSSGARVLIYETTSEAIADFSYLGAGLGNFQQAYYLHRDKRSLRETTQRVDHAHNSYLEMMLEIGVIAFVIFMIPFVWLNYNFIKAVFNRKRDFIFPVVGVSVSALLAVHALFDFSIEIPAIAATYSILMGVCCAQSWSTQHSISDKYPFKITSKPFLVCVLFSTILVGFGFYNSIESGKKLNTSPDMRSVYKNKQVSRERLEKIVNARNAAIEKNKSNAVNYNELGIAQISLANYYNYGSDVRQTLLSDATRNFKLSLKYSPADGWVWLRLAYVEILNSGDYSKASEYIYNSILTDPHGRSILFKRLKMSMIVWDYFSEKHKEQLIQQIKRAAEMSEKHTKEILSSRGLFL